MNEFDANQLDDDAEPGAMRRLRDGLADRAAAAGLLDVAYTTMDSPVGALLLCATTVGLVRVAYATEGHDQVLQRVAARVSPRVLEAPARLDTARRQLDEYFAGARRGFDLPVDWQLTTGFRRQVLEATARLGYGATASYGQVAVAAGSPRAVRAAGTALATNPVPIVVPCHRVLRADRSLGGYVGGPDAKRALLALERVPDQCAQ